MRRIGIGSREKGSMVIARMESKNMKTEVLGDKRKLKGKDVWVEEDLTWEKRRVKWIIRREKHGGRSCGEGG